MGGKRKHFALKTWHLVLLLIPLLFLTATFYRLDHIEMVHLRDAVFSADESGDTDAISSSLAKLRQFTTTHTIINIADSNGNTLVHLGTGPFYLEQSYIRDANAAIEAAESNISDGANPYGNIYQAASDVCKPLARKYGWRWNSQGYMNCMTNELAKYPAAPDISTTILADVPSTELYRYDFSSPIWTLTLSGFSVLLCLAIIVVIFIRFLIYIMLKLILILDKSI